MKHYRVWMLNHVFSFVNAETEEEARKIAIEQAEDAVHGQVMSDSERAAATTIWRVKCVDSPAG